MNISLRYNKINRNRIGGFREQLLVYMYFEWTNILHKYSTHDQFPRVKTLQYKIISLRIYFLFSIRDRSWISELSKNPYNSATFAILTKKYSLEFKTYK